MLPAAALVGMGYCSSKAAVVSLLTVAVGISGISGVGYACTPLDIAPALSGTIMGIQNTFATVSGIVAPLIVAALTAPVFITYDCKLFGVPCRCSLPDLAVDAQHWRDVFYLTAAVACVGAASYCTLASATLIPRLQPGWSPDATAAATLVSQRRKFSSDSTLEPLVEAVPVRGLRSS